MTEQELKRRLDNLSVELEKMREPIKKGINIFSMVGLARQETKHSFFLSNLLKVNNQLGFGKKPIEQLCYAIWYYKPNQGLPQNECILKKGGVASFDELKDAFVTDDLQVIREKYSSDMSGKKSYRDITIVSEKNKSVMVIENKTDSTTHDDQLVKYQDAVNNEYPKYKKVYVYLTLYGEKPTNKNGDYNENWCILDYSNEQGVLSVIKALLGDVSTIKKNKDKVKNVLGDYIEMVNSELLNNKDVLKQCRAIVNAHKEALDMIKEYLSVFEEIQNFLENKYNNNLHTNLCIDDICLVGNTYRQITFTTDFTRKNFSNDDVCYSIEYDTATDENIVGVGRKKDSTTKDSIYNDKILKAYGKKDQTSVIVTQKIYFKYSEFFAAQDKIKFVAEKLNPFLQKIDDIEKTAATIMQSNP